MRLESKWIISSSPFERKNKFYMSPSYLPWSDNAERTDVIIALVVVTLFLIGGFAWYDLGQNGLQMTTMEMVAEHDDNIEKGTIAQKVVVPPFMPTTQQKVEIEQWVRVRRKKADPPKVILDQDIQQNVENVSVDTPADEHPSETTSFGVEDHTPQDNMTTSTTRDSGIMAAIEKPFKPSEEDRLKKRYQRLDSLARANNKEDQQRKNTAQDEVITPKNNIESNRNNRPTKKRQVKSTAQKAAPTASNSSGQCLIMIGAFENMSNSERLIQKLNLDGFEVYQGSEGGLKTVGVRCPCIGERQAIVLSRIRRDYNREAYFIGKI